MSDGKKRDIVIVIIILLTIIGWGGVINKYTLFIKKL